MASLLDTYPLSDAYRERVYPEDQAQHRRSTTPVRADAGALGRLNVLAGIEMSEIGAFRAGQSAYNTGTGWYWEVDPTDGARFSVGNSNLGEPKMLWDGSALTIVGDITATTGEIGGWEIGASTLIGGDTRLDSTGIIEVGTGNNIAKLSSVDATYRLWVGHDDPASAPFRVQQDGSLSATAGAIGGWTLGTTFLQGTNTTLNANGNITLGASNNVVRLSASDATYRLWVGHATAGSAPFRVTQAGALTATGVTISGSITATTGGIGGWSIGASTLTGGNVTLDSGGVVKAGTGDNVAVMSADDATYRLWVGDAVAGSAPFRVQQDGSLVATAGTIGGWTINGTSGIQLGSTSSTRGLSTGTWAFFAGSSNPSTAPFRVSTAGNLVASDIDVLGGSITADAINTGTLNGSLLGSDSVGNSAIASGAVDTLQIADGAILNAKIGNAEISNAKISDLSATKITTGTLTSTTITLGSGGSIVDADGSTWDQSGITLKSGGTFGDVIVWQVGGNNQGAIFANSTEFWVQAGTNDALRLYASGDQVWLQGTSARVSAHDGAGNDVGALTVDASGRVIATGNIFPGNQINEYLSFRNGHIGLSATLDASAGALVGYIEMDINGTVRKIPYYAVS